MKKMLAGVMLIAACLASCALFACAQDEPENAAADSGNKNEEEFEIIRGTVESIDMENYRVTIAVLATGQQRVFSVNPGLLKKLTIGWRVRVKVNRSTQVVVYIKRIRHSG